MGIKKKEELKLNGKWETYGTAFWISMAVSSGIMALLGLVTFVFSVAKLLFGSFEPMWCVLAAAGAGAFALAVFCLDLFPSWAAVVRTIRLANARIEGAMSIQEINKYEERENRRTTDVKDTVQESYTRVGKDVMATQSKVDALDQKFSSYMSNMVNNNDVFKELRNEIAALNRRLEASIESTNRSVRTLQNDLDNIDRIKGGVDSTPPSLGDDVSDSDEQEKEEEKPKTTRKASGARKKNSEKKDDENKEKTGTGKSRKKKKDPEPDNFNTEDDDLTDVAGDYLSGLEEFGVLPTWSGEFLSDSDPYAGRSQEEDEKTETEAAEPEDTVSSAPVESTGPAENTPEVVEESAEDAEDDEVGGYF